jgi:hypothetical protein
MGIHDVDHPAILYNVMYTAIRAVLPVYEGRGRVRSVAVAFAYERAQRLYKSHAVHRDHIRSEEVSESCGHHAQSWNAE